MCTNITLPLQIFQQSNDSIKLNLKIIFVDKESMYYNLLSADRKYKIWYYCFSLDKFISVENKLFCSRN